jgi:ornithine--oxo-acid transaminase
MPARPFCEALMERGLLCKETHDRVIRLAPPLVISREELAWAIEQLDAVFRETDAVAAGPDAGISALLN